MVSTPVYEIAGFFYIVVSEVSHLVKLQWMLNGRII